jgi:hypothetical protein
LSDYILHAHLLLPSTSSFRPAGGAAAFRHWLPLDARHGRILFLVAQDVGLMVSDPVTGEVCVCGLPFPWFSRVYIYWNAAVLCAAAACDHLDCAPGV